MTEHKFRVIASSDESEKGYEYDYVVDMVVNADRFSAIQRAKMLAIREFCSQDVLGVRLEEVE